MFLFPILVDENRCIHGGYFNCGRYELPNVGGSWVKKVELDYNLEHLYCCSDTDLHVYNLDGKELFHFNR
jgi:hypothetical protein